jgi:hypothetical protein
LKRIVRRRDCHARLRNVSVGVVADDIRGIGRIDVRNQLAASEPFTSDEIPVRSHFD